MSKTQILENNLRYIRARQLFVYREWGSGNSRCSLRPAACGIAGIAHACFSEGTEFNYASAHFKGDLFMCPKMFHRPADSLLRPSSIPQFEPLPRTVVFFTAEKAKCLKVHSIWSALSDVPTGWNTDPRVWDGWVFSKVP